MKQLDERTILQMAQKCLKLEADALQATSQSLDSSFVDVIREISETIRRGGKLIFSGIGKNVHICQKLVGTFNSTGAPTIFLDPNQALHGDLGLCREGDLALLFSNQGETEDVLRLLPLVKRMGIKIVAVTGNPNSTLAVSSDLKLSYRVEREACPLNLAPTASTTAAMALGDALAMVHLEVRGLTRDDFARYHPAGSLGKALLLKVAEVMRSGDNFAMQSDGVNVRDALLMLTKARCGTIALTDGKGILSGVFSDGDFRRASIKDEYILQRPVCEYMTRSPKVVREDALAVDALRIFEQSKVNALIVVDTQNRPVGLLDAQDLPRLKIV
jgi:arabinose-5-phosphate isomerase